MPKMQELDLENLSDLLGDFLALNGDSLSGSERDTLSQARYIIEDAIEAGSDA